MNRASQFNRAVERLILFLLCAYFAAHTLPRAWRILNTDFPNYYLTARLAREGVDTARAYEWIWLQRQKDHRSIDQRVVGLAPITPFSTLVMWPIAEFAPLTAKHLWLVANFVLLLGTGSLLKAITGLSPVRIALICALSVPLYRNILYGQYYIVLLFLLTAACWAVQRRYRWGAGMLIGLAAAVKIFPILFTLYFLRKRDWRAVCACAFTSAAALATSIAIFGWRLNRTYLLQVLPSALRGMCLDPYNLHSASLSALLHRLFIYEPQWNAHPALQLPQLFAILHPLLQLALLAPVVLLTGSDDSSPEQTALEWSSLLIAILAISTLPASYHFTVLILPIVVMCAILLSKQRYGFAAVVMVLFLAIGYYGWNTEPTNGWHALLHVPRLYAVMVLTAAAIHMLWQQTNFSFDVSRRWWFAALSLGTIASIASGLHSQYGLFEDYAYRVPMPSEALLAAQPATHNGTVEAIALLPGGYRLLEFGSARASETAAKDVSNFDELSFAQSASGSWIETTTLQSIVRSSNPIDIGIREAESPIVSASTQSIAFLREIQGRNKLFLQDQSRSIHQSILLTPLPSWNVDDIAFFPGGSLVVSARINSSTSALYTISRTGEAQSFLPGEARYPAVSPDDHWLVFSRFQSGYWNLYLRDLATTATRRLTHAPCNQIEPAWEADSKTLLYSSDCGRALSFTAICRRRVIP